jgi:citrate lyase beta subunit
MRRPGSVAVPAASPAQVAASERAGRPRSQSVAESNAVAELVTARYGRGVMGLRPGLYTHEKPPLPVLYV